MTIAVDEKNFTEAVLKAEKPVLVDFWASWCTPCLMMEPVLEELADELKESLTIAKLNTESPERGMLAELYQVRSIPNMKLFKGGKVVAEFVGFRPKEVLKAELEASLV